MHKFVVNPQTHQKFKAKGNHQDRIIFDEYEAWIVQDQTLFI